MYRKNNINKLLKVMSLMSLAFAGLSFSAHAVTFKITEITNVPEGALPEDLNNNGQVVLNKGSIGGAFFWSTTTGAIELENFGEAQVRGINDSGIMVGDNFGSSTLKGDWYIWQNPQNTPFLWKPDSSLNYSITDIGNDNIVVGTTRRNSIDSCESGPIAFKLNLSDITQSIEMSIDYSSIGCVKYGMKGITSGNTLFGQSFLDSGIRYGHIWVWSEQIQTFEKLGNSNTPFGYNSGYYDEQNNRTFVGFQSHNGTCIISSIVREEELREGIRFGLVDRYCQVEAINRHFAIGKVAEVNNGKVETYPYYLDRPLERTRQETSSASALNMNDNIAATSQGWQITQVYDINDKNQFTALAQRPNSKAVPVLVETLVDSLSRPNVDSTGDRISVSWNPNSDASEYAKTYFLQERKNSGNWSTIWQGSSTAVNLNGKGQAHYQYRVYYSTTFGTESEPSSTASIEIDLRPDTPHFESVTVSGTTIFIDWSDELDADHYYREVSINGGGWQSRTRFDVSNATYRNQQPRSYRYRVEACNDYGCSEPSQPSATVAVQAPSLDVPNPPFATVSGTTIRINWDDVDGADHYYRQVSINGGGWQNARKFDVSEATYPNQKPRSYRYRVRACDASRCTSYSGASNTVTVN